jgi:hypothetical protein
MKVVDAEKLEELGSEFECDEDTFYAARRIKAILSTAREEGGALREALETLVMKMNKVTAWWRHTHKVVWNEMDNLCNAQLDAEDALAASDKKEDSLR